MFCFLLPHVAQLNGTINRLFHNKILAWAKRASDLFGNKKNVSKVQVCVHWRIENVQYKLKCSEIRFNRFISGIYIQKKLFIWFFIPGIDITQSMDRRTFAISYFSFRWFFQIEFTTYFQNSLVHCLTYSFMWFKNWLALFLGANLVLHRHC